MYPNETQKYHTPSKLAWVVTLLTYIQMAHSFTNQDKIISIEPFYDYTQSLQANAKMEF
jgi:hypothetical protein